MGNKSLSERNGSLRWSERAIMHPRFTFLQTYFKYKRFSYLYESKDQSENDPYNLSILNEECHEEDSDDKEQQQDIKLLKSRI